jgi:hypothetical protein
MRWWGAWLSPTPSACGSLVAGFLGWPRPCPACLGGWVPAWLLGCPDRSVWLARFGVGEGLDTAQKFI